MKLFTHTSHLSAQFWNTRVLCGFCEQYRNTGKGERRTLRPILNRNARTHSPTLCRSSQTAKLRKPPSDYVFTLTLTKILLRKPQFLFQHFVLPD